MVNVTNYFQNMTDISSMMQIPNSQTGGWFWLAMHFMLFIIATITMSATGSITIALLSAGFLALISGLFAVYLGLFAWKWLLFYVGLLLVLLFYNAWNNKKDAYG